jgi:hypothetical protein
MIKTRLAIVALVITGLAGSTLAADAKTYKRTKQESSMTTGANTKSSGATTGANTKSGTTTGMGGAPAKNPSGPGTNNNYGK